MSYSQDGSYRSYAADADFTANAQYRAVKRTATGIALCGAADVAFLGILQDDPALGEFGTVKVRSASQAVAGAAVAAGAALTTDATGRLITAVATNPIVARALEAAAAASDLFAVEIDRAGAA